MYALTTHCRELGSRPSSLPMLGRATPTIETSSPSRKRTPQTSTSNHQARASKLVFGDCADSCCIRASPVSGQLKVGSICIHMHCVNPICECNVCYYSGRFRDERGARQNVVRSQERPPFESMA